MGLEHLLGASLSSKGRVVRASFTRQHVHDLSQARQHVNHMSDEHEHDVKDMSDEHDVKDMSHDMHVNDMSHEHELKQVSQELGLVEAGVSLLLQQLQPSLVFHQLQPHSRPHQDTPTRKAQDTDALKPQDMSLGREGGGGEGGEELKLDNVLLLARGGNTEEIGAVQVQGDETDGDKHLHENDARACTNNDVAHAGIVAQLAALRLNLRSLDPAVSRTAS